MENVNENEMREELEKEADLAKRAQWIREAKERKGQPTKRKADNHMKIVIGVAVVKMIEDGKLDMQALLDYVVVNKQEPVKQWISNQSEKK